MGGATVPGDGPSAGPGRFLLAAYFLSGAVALALEVLWFRNLELILGATAPAVTALLSGWMLGMSAGSRAAGRLLAGRAVSPPGFLGLLHLLFALSGAALLLPLPAAALPSGTPLLVQLLAGALLVAPTAALAGAALPAVAGCLPPGKDRAPSLALLYGVNIVGGAVGIAFVAFAGLEHLGARTCTLLVMAAAVFLAAAFPRFSPSGATEQEGRRPEGSGGGAGRGFWVSVSFVLGFLGLATETALVRVLTPVMGLSVYALAGTVLPFLLGLGTGAVAARTAGRRDPEKAFVAAALLAALGWAAVVAVLPILPRGLLWLAGVLSEGTIAWGGLLSAQVAAALVVLFPAAVCTGALFPLLFAVVSPGSGPGPGEAGTLNAANTLGAVLGPVAVTAFLVGTVGSSFTLRGLAAGYLVVAAAAAVAEGFRPSLPVVGCGVVAAAALAAAPASHPLEQHSGVYWAAGRYAARGGSPWTPLRELAGGERKVLASIEGPTAAVLVVEEGPQRYLAIDGKPASNTYLDSPTQRMLARLPFSLAGGVKRVLVIGWGSGQTAAEVLREPVEEVVCAEISPEVTEAAPWFSKVNGPALEDERLVLLVDDARHYLSSGGEGFDLIISQPSNPWTGFSGSLFTREFFRHCRRRLNRGGMLIQWFQAYGVTENDMEVFMATFGSEFPSWRLWSPAPGDLVFAALRGDGTDAVPPGAPPFEEVYLGGEDDFGIPGGTAMNTDDRPVLSYRLARQVLLTDPAEGMDAFFMTPAAREPGVRRRDSAPPETGEGPGR